VTEIVGEKVAQGVKIEYADVMDLIHADAVVLAMGYEESTDHTISANIASIQNEKVINE